MDKDNSKQLVMVVLAIVFSVIISSGVTYFMVAHTGLALKSLEANPNKFASLLFVDKMREAVKTQQQKAQKKQMEEMAKKEEEKLNKEFENPKKPKIDSSRAIFGPQTAAITIVEYSDFQCPYCTRAYQTMKEVKKAYGDKVRVLYKHLPLDFHKQARRAAEYYEAVALQGTNKAEKFHDYLFENAKGLNTDDKGAIQFLDGVVKKVGANLAKVKKDVKSSKIKKIIDEDIAEANSFGFRGTPAFLINGVGLSGARPFDSFKKIIDRHLNSKS